MERYRLEKMSGQRRDFFMSNPIKKLFFWSKPFYIILRTHNFFVETFLKARGLENSCLLHKTGNVQITGLLHVMLAKEVDWKSVVKTWKRLSTYGRASSLIGKSNLWFMVQTKKLTTVDLEEWSKDFTQT